MERNSLLSLSTFPSYFNALTLKSIFALNVSSDFPTVVFVIVMPQSLPESLISLQLAVSWSINTSLPLLVLLSAVYSFQLPIILQKFLFCNEGSWLLEASQNLWPMIYNIYLMT